MREPHYHCPVDRGRRRFIPGGLRLPACRFLGDPLLSVEGLRTIFQTYQGTVAAVDLSVGREHTRHCKRVRLRQVDAVAFGDWPRAVAGTHRGGAMVFDNVNLLTLSAAGRQAIRGWRVAMIFQEPMTGRNPMFPPAIRSPSRSIAAGPTGDIQRGGRSNACCWIGVGLITTVSGQSGMMVGVGCRAPTSQGQPAATGSCVPAIRPRSGGSSAW